MRIAVDARELCHHPTGVGRYLAELLAEWSSQPDARRHEWRLYAHRPPAVPPDWATAVRLVEGAGGTAWEQGALPRALARDGADVLFAPGYTAPLTAGVPIALTVHDVSFCAHPEWFPWREGMRRRLITGWAARRARVVLTDSAFSQAEIVTHLGLPAPKVRVIPLGMRAPGRLKPDTTDREPRVLFVGSVFERRRVDRLIECFDAVADAVPGARLDIVGENRTARPRVDLDALVSGLRHAGAVRVRSYVDDATLRDLYASASVFVFLSEYEGFGLTPLEALAAGVPPVVLDTPIAREVCGPAARYIPASTGLADLSATIVDCLTREGARQDILRHAAQVIDRYVWARTAAATLAAIEEAALGR
jgi:glycosyltransferase involved in cell wall biosynthesis